MKGIASPMILTGPPFFSVSMALSRVDEIYAMEVAVFVSRLPLWS